MVHLKVSTLVRAPKTKVFEVLKDPRKLLRFARGVETVRVLDSRDSITLVHFQGRLGWLRLKSVHKAVLRPPDELCFLQVRGDFKRLEGSYTLMDESQGTRVIYTIDFDLGIPLIGDLLGETFAKRAMRAMAEELLEGIKREAEG